MVGSNQNTSMSEFIGPALPPDLLQHAPDEEEEEGGGAQPLVGPALPPELSVEQQWKGKEAEEEKEEEDTSERQPADVLYGPSLPPSLPQEEEEEHIIGPVLPAQLQPGQLLRQFPVTNSKISKTPLHLCDQTRRKN